jgi:hypothetical protein
MKYFDDRRTPHMQVMQDVCPNRLADVYPNNFWPDSNYYSGTGMYDSLMFKANSSFASQSKDTR